MTTFPIFCYIRTMETEKVICLTLGLVALVILLKDSLVDAWWHFMADRAWKRAERDILRDMDEELSEWRIMSQECAHGTLYQLQRKVRGMGDGMVRGYRWRTEATFGARIDALEYLHWIRIGRFMYNEEARAHKMAEAIQGQLHRRQRSTRMTWNDVENIRLLHAENPSHDVNIAPNSLWKTRQKDSVTREDIIRVFIEDVVELNRYLARTEQDIRGMTLCRTSVERLLVITSAVIKFKDDHVAVEVQIPRDDGHVTPVEK